MLIGPDRMRVPNNNRHLRLNRPHTVRNNSVIGKIAPANHVACPHCGYRRLRIGKKAADIAVRYQLRAGLRIGIGVMSI